MDVINVIIIVIAELFAAPCAHAAQTTPSC
jgi:hypothetical protein